MKFTQPHNQQNQVSSPYRHSHTKLTKLVLYAMLGSVTYAGKVAMESIPNVHPVALLLMAFTVVYRVEALIPLYVYVFLVGLFNGFGLWWYPYLYIWTILWGVTMLLPKHMKPKVAAVVYPLVCALFGLAFGTLYAPAQALLFHYDLATTLKWILVGLPYDFIHCMGNLAMGLLVYPLVQLLRKLNRTIGLRLD